MATLGIPQNTIAILQKYNFMFQKRYGQNFLIDTRVLDKIISASGITKDDMIKLPLMSKSEVASEILSQILKNRDGK